MAKRCKATKANGEPCRAYARADSDYCFWHDPATMQACRDAGRKGGHARHGRTLHGDAEPVQIRKATDVLPILAQAIANARQLEPSIKRARCIGYLCGQVVKVFKVTDMEQRLEALYAVLARRDDK